MTQTTTTELTCTVRNKSRQGSIKIIPLWLTNICQSQLLRICNGSTSESITTAFAFAIDLKAPINSFSVGSTPRACVIGHWGNSSMMSGLSLSDLEWVSQQYALFVMYVLRINLPRVLHVQELEALEEPPLIALAQILLHTLDVSLKEPFVGIVTDPVKARIF